MLKEKANEKQEIPAICRCCMNKPCKFGLQVEAIMGCLKVLNKSMAVPLKCPLLMTDEYWIRNQLLQLSPWDLDWQRIAALQSEWNSGNFGELCYTYGNPVPEAIEYILQKWQQGKCTIIGLRPGQKYPLFLKPVAPPQWLIDKLHKKKRDQDDLQESESGNSLPSGLDNKW